MARRRKEKAAQDIRLQQPDRSGPSEKTLLDIAQEKGLFDQAERQQQKLQAGRLKKIRVVNGSGDDDEEEEEEGLSPTAERVLDTLLWTVSLAMLHFTLDVLVQHQYAVEIVWWSIAQRTGQAFLVFALLFYPLHPHPSSPILLPRLPARYQPALRQAIFFVVSIVAGCYLIHISNRHGYLAVMKRAPPLGCLWIWSVIELNLPLAVVSLAGAAGFAWKGGYDFK